MSFSLLSGLILICVIVIVVCLIYLKLLNKIETATDDSTHAHMEIEPLIIGDRFRILGSQHLIQELKLDSALNNIRANLGLSDENWQKDAVPFLHNYIAFVQRLPASESHHHAGDGGLVKHTLDVAALALMASTAQSWPPNAKTEDIAKKTAAWRYGIMCAAILHDVGKTLTTFHIELYRDTKDDECILWLPDAGSMVETGRQFYRVSFPENKVAYATHAEIAWTFFQAIVPSHVRQWLTETDSQLMLALRHYLSGQKDNNALHPIITQADMASVSRDLKSGSRQRFSTATRTPLIEIIMETLREMLSQRGSYFSIATHAGGDLFRQGDTVYMMSKNVPDYIRQYLRSTNHKSAPSFPTDNQRIFDTLLEYGAVEPDSFDEKRAVQYIRVIFMRSDGAKKDNIFSVLKFKLTTLFPDGNYPSEFQGVLTPIEDKAQTATNNQNEAVPVVQQNETDETANNQSVAVNYHESAMQDVIHTDHNNHQETVADKVMPIAEPVVIKLPEKNKTSEPVQKHGFAIELPKPPKKREQPNKPIINQSVDDDSVEKAVTQKDSTSHDSSCSTDVLNIDNLLDKYQLLDVDSDENKMNESTLAAEPKTVDVVTQNHLTVNSSDNAVQITEVSLSNNTNKKQGKNALLAELFANPKSTKDTTTQPNQVNEPSNDILPNEDLAQAGLADIAKQRERLPTTTPRPVAVYTPPSLEQLKLAEALTPFSNDDVETEQSTDNSKETDDMNALEAIKLELRERGSQFLTWLANGLADGSIEVNHSRAPVHFIDKGMLLVTPAIFKEYAGGVFNKMEPRSPGPMAQRGFEQLKLHQRQRRSAIYRAITTKEDGKKLFYCYLIPEENIKHIIQPASRPQNNTNITLQPDDDNLLQMKE